MQRQLCDVFRERKDFDWLHKVPKYNYINKLFPRQPQEIDDGNREYKWFLSKASHLVDKIATQLKYRLYEGDGKALYIIGVMDDGDPIGISTKKLLSSLSLLYEASQIISNTLINTLRIYKAREGYIATIRLSNDKLEISWVL